MIGRLLAVAVVLAVVALGVALLVVSRIPAVEVTVHDVDRTMDGYTLFTPTNDDLGGDAETSVVYLIDMDGAIVHTWTVLGGAQLARLAPDGNLFYSTRDLSFRPRAGVREVDPFGNVLWFYNVWVDHDFALLENGNVLIHYVEDTEAPAVGPGVLRCPRIVEVTREKETVWEWRGEDHVAELEDLVGITFPLAIEGERGFDWAHNNSCHVIGPNDAAASDARFAAGNVIVSYPNLNTLAVIARDTGEIVWAWGPGSLDGQHSPAMMRSGRMLVFDNGTERGYSRVVQLDPVAGEIVWEYSDPGRFFSAFVSGAQPLDNGNVFVCQGSGRRGVTGLLHDWLNRAVGRAGIQSRLFEVSAEGEIVWDCTVSAAGRNMHAVYQAARYAPPDVRALLERLDAAATDETRRLKSLPYVR